MQQIDVRPSATPVQYAAALPRFESGVADIDTLFLDNFHHFELLAMLVDEEPLDNFDPMDRSMMQSTGIEKGKPFNPDTKMKTLLTEAARLGGAMARANTGKSTSGAYFYTDRQWQGISGSASVVVWVIELHSVIPDR
ncbi:MAG: hypothetical protein WAM90_08750 [Rhodanobacter sp.]